MGELKQVFLEKVKVFVLYAVKIVEGDLIDRLFAILERSYGAVGGEFCSRLFEDYKELNCAE